MDWSLFRRGSCQLPTSAELYKFNPSATATTQIITGLQPDTRYDVSIQRAGNAVNVTISQGTALKADSGGVLVIKAAK